MTGFASMANLMMGVKTEGWISWPDTSQNDRSEPTRAGTELEVDEVEAEGDEADISPGSMEAACFGSRLGGKVLPLFLPFITSRRINALVSLSTFFASVDTIKANSRGEVSATIVRESYCPNRGNDMAFAAEIELPVKVAGEYWRR